MGWKYRHRLRCGHFGVACVWVGAMIDRETSRCLALKFDGKPGAPRTDAWWTNLIDAFEQARDEHSASRVMLRLKEAKYVPQPGDVLKALAADTICSDCCDTGLVGVRPGGHRCGCVEGGLLADCWKCHGTGFIEDESYKAVERCHCVTAKAAA